MEIKKRNYGVDLLRICCMIGIIMLHIFNYGGMLTGDLPDGNFTVVWIWEIAAYSSVNCFVLISGYLGFRGKKYTSNLKNIINLFFTVLFYSVLIKFSIKLLFPVEVSLKDLVKAFFPITTRQYWFFSSYFVMFVFSPLINLVVDKASNRTLTAAGIAVFAISVMTLAGDAFGLKDGNSAAWFLFVYFIGALMKKFDIINTISAKKLF